MSWRNQAVTDVSDLSRRLLAGERAALARAITLVESTRADHRAQAGELLAALLPHAGRGIRLGITGTPGVGKSTFIEAFGTLLTGLGRRVAVLAVDPSSARSGGSILGDKTRMERLARDPHAFIRPSPAGRTLGGVARRTREAILLVEAAGFDVVIVETVGVGQSETAVAEMVDLFALLLAPAGGDDLQGIKRGIMELADLVVVNKADGDLLPAARHAAADYAHALHLIRPRDPAWVPKVLLASAVKGEGLDAIWQSVEAYRAALEPGGALARRRADQAVSALWRELNEGLVEALRADPDIAARLPRVEAAVRAGRATPTRAALDLLATFIRSAARS
jgi:LAO/AO transport system kinase